MLWGSDLAASFRLPDSPQGGPAVAIDGVIIPIRERFEWDKTRIWIVADNVQSKREPMTDPERDARALQAHLVTVEGLIDSRVEDPSHFKLNIAFGNILAIVYTSKAGVSSEPHFKTGDYVRFKGVCSAQLGRNGHLANLAFWVASPSDIQVIGSLKADPRFALPVTRSENLSDKPEGELVHCSRGRA